MKRLLILTAVAMMLAAPGCRGMRGWGQNALCCPAPEPVCGQPGYMEGSYLPPATTIPTLPGPYETLPPSVPN